MAITNNTKQIIRKLANTIRAEIKDISGDEVSLDPLEGRIIEGDEEGAIEEIKSIFYLKVNSVSQNEPITNQSLLTIAS